MIDLFIGDEHYNTKNKMSETEKYLNSILSKRLGSVINNGASSQNAHTVARIPLAEEPLEKMPTVFRKKY